ncbi:cobalt ECF transporter T component CbiQ [bacterium]|nr:cobalt ECF transporter T component CbiQ [bacterium]
MIKEIFKDGNSIIHHLDPRIKILAASFFSIVVAISSSWGLLLMAFLFCVIVIALARLNMKSFILRLIIVNGFVFFLWLFLPFTYPGRPFFSIGPLTASWEGILYSLVITAKSNIIIIACIGLLSTSSVFSLVHALSHLHVPDKLIQILFFNYRYIHVLHLEYINMIKTLKVRCFKPRTSLLTYKTFANLVAMLLLKSYDRAERVYKAMLCRGFKGKYYVLDHFRLTRKDIVIGSTMFLFILGMILCEFIPICL